MQRLREEFARNRTMWYPGMAILAAVALLPQCQPSMDAHLDGKSDSSSAHARAPSPRTLEPTDTGTLSRLHLREKLFESLHVTEEARARLARLEQVGRVPCVK
jgi:hypothetical protein